MRLELTTPAYLCTVYKYRALTDCATGAIEILTELIIQEQDRHLSAMALTKILSGVGFEPTQSFDYESLNLTP